MIYLDNSGTTQPLPEVVRVVSDVMLNVYGNPSSLHGIGLKAERLLEEARQIAAGQLGVDPSEIVFTSGGTESNNLAIKGAARQYRERGRHVVTTEIEHASVYQAFEQLRRDGFDVTFLKPDHLGRVSAEQVENALRDDTILVSVMSVNNEIGTVQPIADIARVLHRRRKTLFHVDAVQAFGKVPLPDGLEGIDLLSLSGHKFHGPKGTGVLYVRNGIQLHPLLAGGGQESGRRSGTENVPGIAGLAKAMQMSRKRLHTHRRQWSDWKQFMLERLADIPGAKLNGDTTREGGAPHIVSVSFPGLKGEVLLHALEEHGVYVSTKSACSSKRNVPSRVLAACNLSEAEAEGTLRISMGQNTSREDIEQAVKAIEQTVRRLRREVGEN